MTKKQRSFFSEQQKDAGKPKSLIVIPAADVPQNCSCTWSYRMDKTAELRYSNTRCQARVFHARLVETVG